MTRDRRLLLLLGLLMAYGLFVVECKYHQHEDPETTEVKHRHRHRHESLNRRSHHEPDWRSWQDVNYDYDGDSDEPIDDDDDDYEMRSYYDYHRSYSRAAQRAFLNRMFEPHYSARIRNSGYYGWRNEDHDRRRIPVRHSGKNRRHRTGSSYPKFPYLRPRDTMDYRSDEEADFDYERPRKYSESSEVDRHLEMRRKARRRASWKRDRMDRMYGYHGLKRHYSEDRDDTDRSGSSRWANDWRNHFRSIIDWSNLTEHKSHYPKSNKKPEDKPESEDYEDHGGLEEGDKDEEDDIWKLDDNEEENEGEEELDNDFYKSETKPPLKTYDEIIRKLTNDEPTTQRSITRRDYRNIPYHSTNTERRPGHGDHYKNSRNETGFSKLTEPAKFSSRSHMATMFRYPASKQIAEITTVKSARKTKSLEQDYEFAVDNAEKEDDLAKAGVEEDSDMQADVTTTDYTDDENGDEDETPADAFTAALSKTTTTTTTTARTTTTTTTTTPKPPVNQHYDHRETRKFERGTGAQYNGYQGKNEYPPMSPHSVQKWQDLGTRASVKETRNKMQQNSSKNGEDIKEAIENARKVNKEGSCKWPRARLIQVRDFYPNPSTIYIPHCAILHRCSDDTGCCRSEALTCVPKRSDRVDLSFYTKHLQNGSTVVTKLMFYNHTECECRERSEYMENKKHAEPLSYQNYQPSPPENMKRQAKKSCKCPSQFLPRVTPEGICQCNCNENNRNCTRTRRGRGYFSLTDRLCIQSKECAMPSCEFGEYIQVEGRCPLKRETLELMMNYRANLNQRHRS